MTPGELKLKLNTGFPPSMQRRRVYTDIFSRTAGLAVKPLKPDPDVICRGLGDSAVLLHLSTNEIFELNATGYRVWQMISEGLERDEMRARLLREFDVAAERLETELDQLLAELSARQLVVER